MKPIHSILVICILMAIASCRPTKIEPSETDLEKLLSNIDAFEKNLNAQDSLSQGFHLRGDFSPQTSSHFKNQLPIIDSFLKQIDALPEENLEEEINKAVLRYKLLNQKSEIEFKRYYIPLNAEGGFYNWINYSLTSLPFNTVKDYEAYLGWLPSYVKYLRQNRLLLKEGMANGMVASKVVAKNTLRLLRPWVSTYKPPSPLSVPFHQIPESISKAQAASLQNQLNKILAELVYPAYDSLYQFIETTYLPACTEQVGIMAIENGKAYYENRVAHFTTLSISPDSVFNLGLSEVERIKQNMQEVINQSTFTGTIQDYIDYLRTDEKFYPKTPEELLHYAAWLSKKAEGKLPQYFEHLYSNPFTVKPVPEAIAPTYTVGRYSPGSLTLNKPGEYWVNTYNLSARPLYAMPALTLHEAVPGHHLHHAITEELADLPDFRKTFYISAFGEGWGLYSEFLGEEMGMYSTPEEWFGRYTYEMWRACRLVVDVGMHYKGWTRQEAIDFLASNTALSMHEIQTEIDRYIGWPGQAVSYKMGELKIKHLRSVAEENLGEQFNLRSFHNMLLSQGSVPLPLLDKMVSMWINQQKHLNQ